MKKMLSMGSVCLAAAGTLATGVAYAQLPLQITARDDRPAPVDIRVEAKDSGGAVLLTTVVSWAADDNGWSTLPPVPIALPTSTSNLRLTFINDFFGGGGPDTDRNAFIDSLSVDGVLKEGEDFDRTGGPDPVFPGCPPTTVDGRGCAGCGNQNDWVEYDVPFTGPLPSCDGHLPISPLSCNFFDGTHAFCPCAPGDPYSGCDIPQNTGGVLAIAIAQNLAPNGATIKGCGYSTMGSPTAIVIRSNQIEPVPVVFGDGVRCVNSLGLVRLAATTAMNGVSCHEFGPRRGPMGVAKAFESQVLH